MGTAWTVLPDSNRHPAIGRLSCIHTSVGTKDADFGWQAFAESSTSAAAGGARRALIRILRRLANRVRFEPTTSRLTTGRACRITPTVPGSETWTRTCIRWVRTTRAAVAPSQRNPGWQERIRTSVILINSQARCQSGDLPANLAAAAGIGPALP